jgi:hypothetical protein
MVATKDVIGKVCLVGVLTFSNYWSDLFEGKMNELVVQVDSISLVKIDRLECDLSDAYLKNNYNNLGCFHWENVKRD